MMTTLEPGGNRQGASRKCHDGPDFDRAVARSGDFRRDPCGFFGVARLDEIESAELLLGFRERTIDHQGLAVPHPNSSGRGRRLERVASLDRVRKLLAEGSILLQLPRVVAVRGPALLLIVNQQKELH